MSKVRVIYRQDGGVSVIHPILKSKRSEETKAQWLKRVFDKATPEGVEYDEIDSSELPSREDRSAWERKSGKGKGITVNVVKAQRLRKEKEDREKIEKEEKLILREMAIKRLTDKKEL